MAEPGWLTTAEVAEMLGVHPETVRRIPAGRLPYVTTDGGEIRGGRRKYRQGDVDQYLRQPRQPRERRPRTSTADRFAKLEERVTAIEQRLDGPVSSPPARPGRSPRRPGRATPPQ